MKWYKKVWAATLDDLHTIWSFFRDYTGEVVLLTLLISAACLLSWGGIYSWEQSKADRIQCSATCKRIGWDEGFTYHRASNFLECICFSGDLSERLSTKRWEYEEVEK